MKILKQGAYTSNVRWYDDTHAIADACLLSTDFEGSVTVIFERATMKITEARWAIHRAADAESRGQGFAPMLIGESAHANEKNCAKILPDYSRSVDYSLPPGGWEGEVQEHKSTLTPATESREEAKATGMRSPRRGSISGSCIWKSSGGSYRRSTICSPREGIWGTSTMRRSGGTP